MMSNVQFYLAIGLPVFSILLVWLGSTLMNNRAIAAIGQRIDELGRRIDDQAKSLGQRIDDLRSEMKSGFDNVNERLGRLEIRFDRIEDEVRKDHESRISRLETRVFTRTA